MQIEFSKATRAILKKNESGQILTDEEIDSLQESCNDRLGRAEAYRLIATHHQNRGREERSRAATETAKAFWRQAVTIRMALFDQGALY